MKTWDVSLGMELFVVVFFFYVVILALIVTQVDFIVKLLSSLHILLIF